MKITREFIEELRSQLRLEDLIDLSEFTKVGHDLRGPHPVHGSTTGTNFSVDLDNQIWHCFRCGSGGDVFSLIAVQEGLVDCSEASDISHIFPEVIRIACEYAGVKPPEYSAEERRKLRKLREEEELLQKIFEDTLKFYRNQLEKHPEVKTWIREKYGDYWNDELLERFGIGYAPPDGDALTRFLIERYGRESALKSGLVIKLGDKLKDLFTGRVVFPYFVRGRALYFIARSTPWTPEDPMKKAKYLKQLTHSEKHPYVSELVREPIYGVDSIRGAKEAVIAEGVADAVSTIAHGFPALSPVTTRFKEEHIPELEKHISNRTVYVVNDNEESGAGLSGALSILRGLNSEVKLVILPKPENVEKIDLNDYFKVHTAEDFKELLKKAIPKGEALLRFSDSIFDIFRVVLREKGFDPDRVFAKWNNKTQNWSYIALDKILPDEPKLAVAMFRRDNIDGYSNQVDPTLRHTIISGVVLRRLLKEGRFLRESQGRVYYFSENEKRVYRLDDDNEEFEAFLYNFAGLNPGTRSFRETLSESQAYALRHGEKVEVYRDFHFDKKKKTLYVYLQNGEFLCLTGDRIEKYPNGTNGIYFVRNSLVEPVHYIPPEERRKFEIPGQVKELRGDGNIFIQAVCNRLSFDPNSELTIKQQRDLLALYYYSIPFGNFLSTVPILTFIGEKGSAKTSSIRLFGKLLYGQGFDVSSLEDGCYERDFVAMLANWSFIAIDNVDSPLPWLENALAKVATRGVYRMRKLFTNAEEIDVPIRSFIALTSRDPHFRRDDVAERLLIIKTRRLERFIPEGVLFEAVTEYRNEVFSQFVDDLNKIVKALKEVNLAEIVTPHRLADWVAFAEVASEALGMDVNSIRNACEILDDVRANFAVGSDLLYIILKDWVEVQNTGEWMTATQLYYELREFAEIVRLDFYLRNPVSLARKLQNLKPELERLLGMETQYNSHKKVWLYRFPKPERSQSDTVSREDDNGGENGGNERSQKPSQLEEETAYKSVDKSEEDLFSITDNECKGNLRTESHYSLKESVSVLWDGNKAECDRLLRLKAFLIASKVFPKCVKMLSVGDVEEAVKVALEACKSSSSLANTKFAREIDSKQLEADIRKILIEEVMEMLENKVNPKLFEIANLVSENKGQIRNVELDVHVLRVQQERVFDSNGNEQMRKRLTIADETSVFKSLFIYETVGREHHPISVKTGDRLLVRGATVSTKNGYTNLFVRNYGWNIEVLAGDLDSIATNVLVDGKLAKINGTIANHKKTMVSTCQHCGRVVKVLSNDVGKCRNCGEVRCRDTIIHRFLVKIRDAVDNEIREYQAVAYGDVVDKKDTLIDVIADMYVSMRNDGMLEIYKIENITPNRPIEEPQPQTEMPTPQSAQQQAPVQTIRPQTPTQVTPVQPQTPVVQPPQNTPPQPQPQAAPQVTQPEPLPELTPEELDIVARIFRDLDLRILMRMGDYETLLKAYNINSERIPVVEEYLKRKLEEGGV